MNKKIKILNMLKVVILMLITIQLLNLSVCSLRANAVIENTDRYSIVNQKFEEWVEEQKEIGTLNKDEDYHLNSVGFYENTSSKIVCGIQYYAKNEENIEYDENHNVVKTNFHDIMKYLNMELTSSDGKNYEIASTSSTPIGYDEFIKEFEEYKSQNPDINLYEEYQEKRKENFNKDRIKAINEALENGDITEDEAKELLNQNTDNSNTEIISVSGKNISYSSGNEEIATTSIIIRIIAILVIISIIVFYVVKFAKIKKNRNK
jgi:hypothetical protein